jgi:hypothetical protein
MSWGRALKIYSGIMGTLLDILIVFTVCAPIVLVVADRYEREHDTQVEATRQYKGDADDWCREYCGSTEIYLNDSEE